MRAAAILIFDKCLYFWRRLRLTTARRLSAYMAFSLHVMSSRALARVPYERRRVEFSWVELSCVGEVSIATPTQLNSTDLLRADWLYAATGSVALPIVGDSWVASVRVSIATQLNSTRRRVELCRYKWAFTGSVCDDRCAFKFHLPFRFAVLSEFKLFFAVNWWHLGKTDMWSLLLTRNCWTQVTSSTARMHSLPRDAVNYCYVVAVMSLLLVRLQWCWVAAAVSIALHPTDTPLRIHPTHVSAVRTADRRAFAVGSTAISVSVTTLV